MRAVLILVLFCLCRLPIAGLKAQDKAPKATPPDTASTLEFNLHPGAVGGTFSSGEANSGVLFRGSISAHGHAQKWDGTIALDLIQGAGPTMLRAPRSRLRQAASEKAEWPAVFGHAGTGTPPSLGAPRLGPGYAARRLGQAVPLQGEARGACAFSPNRIKQRGPAALPSPHRSTARRAQLLLLHRQRRRSPDMDTPPRAPCARASSAWS